MEYTAQNFHEPDLQEHPEQLSLLFMLGMLLTYFITLSLLAIPLMVISAKRGFKARRMSVVGK
ncbi:MAG TPA: hypothetical protein VL728_12270 [Cyclobacteriaceae bacterium]|jgi:hypothetical protein|nr:hypothetical protein [Cyclobacteriaceae bacterium]